MADKGKKYYLFFEGTIAHSTLDIENKEEYCFLISNGIGRFKLFQHYHQVRKDLNNFNNMSQHNSPMPCLATSYALGRNNHVFEGQNNRKRGVDLERMRETCLEDITLDDQGGG